MSDANPHVVDAQQMGWGAPPRRQVHDDPADIVSAVQSQQHQQVVAGLCTTQPWAPKASSVVSPATGSAWAVTVAPTWRRQTGAPRPPFRSGRNKAPVTRRCDPDLPPIPEYASPNLLKMTSLAFKLHPRYAVQRLL